MRLIYLVIGLCLDKVAALSWGLDKQRVLGSSLQNEAIASSHDDKSSLPKAYSLALSELQELESEPICHRNAARLLVNNCQLLDGKDESTVLTDTGRAARDFVDSYAASLAICDLERGSFRIPTSCAQFREEALMRLPTPNEPELHVSTKEIDMCLEGLAQSDSAWNTWVSYRHKALRFCDAARADNEKDEHIQLYQRVTKILSRLTTDIEEHMKSRLDDVDQAIQRTSSNLEDINDGVGAVTASLKDLDHLVTTKIYKTAEQSHDIVARAATDAQKLHELLTAMNHDIARQNENLAASYGSAIESFQARADSETEIIMATFASMMSATTYLQNELATSHARTEEVAQSQERVEENMRSLERKADSLSSRYEEHSDQLQKAHDGASQILLTLDSAATSATTLTSSLSTTFAAQGWWPYIYCPAASLMMGSYGLPPSAVRNIALVGIGEVAGFFVSNISNIISNLQAASFFPNGLGETQTNATSFQGTYWAETDLINNDLRKRQHVRDF